MINGSQVRVVRSEYRQADGSQLTGIVSEVGSDFLVRVTFDQQAYAHRPGTRRPVRVKALWFDRDQLATIGGRPSDQDRISELGEGYDPEWLAQC